MSKYLNIPNGDYKIAVQDQGTITLDVGNVSSLKIDITNVNITSPNGKVEVTLTTSATLKNGDRVTLDKTELFDGNGISISDINGRHYIKFINTNIIELYTDPGLRTPYTVDPTYTGAQTGELITSQGKVVVTGDLEVFGETTIIETTDLTVTDNIIVLNEGGGDEGGIKDRGGERISGIQIDRGSLSHARFVFDENITWTDPANPGTSDQGAFTFKDVNGRKLAIECISISTSGGDLNLIGQTSAGNSSGVVSVFGTNDYENNVTEDDHIPNKKYVDDYVVNYLLNNFTFKLLDGNIAQSYVEVRDNERTGVDSEIGLGIDGQDVIVVRAASTDIHDISISGNTIKTINEFDDLVLQADGTGNVKINDTLYLDPTPHVAYGGSPDIENDPTAPSVGVKIYSKEQGTGATNIYYVNETGRRDELISNNRALLYGMLF